MRSVMSLHVRTDLSSTVFSLGLIYINNRMDVKMTQIREMVDC